MSEHTASGHEYRLRKDAEAAARDQTDNMGRPTTVEYNGRGFVLRRLMAREIRAIAKAEDAEVD